MAGQSRLPALGAFGVILCRFRCQSCLRCTLKAWGSTDCYARDEEKSDKKDEKSLAAFVQPPVHILVSRCAKEGSEDLWSWGLAQGLAHVCHPILDNSSISYISSKEDARG